MGGAALSRRDESRRDLILGRLCALEGAQVAAQLFPVFLLESSAFGSAIGAESLAAAVSDYGT